MVKSEDFVILAVPDSLPVLEPDSLAPPTFILVGMAVLMIDVSGGEKRLCSVQKLQCENKVTSCHSVACDAPRFLAFILHGNMDKARHSVLASTGQIGGA